MKPHKRQERRVNIDYDCDVDGCGGVLYCDNPEKDENGKYHHVCKGCGQEYTLDRIYPYEDIEFIDL